MNELLFNGIDLVAYFGKLDKMDKFIVNNIFGRGPITQETMRLSVPGMNGSHLQGTRTPDRVLGVKISLRSSSLENMRKDIEDLNSLIATNIEVPIVFPDEPERTYFGVLDGETIWSEIIYTGQGTLYFTCPDPYKYGPEQPTAIPDDAAIIQNNGTADADPIFELEVLAPVTFAMVQNENEEYQLIGKPADVDTEVVDTRALLLEERGATLDTWQTTPIAVDGGVASGVMGTDADGITVPDYGTGDKWHGPGLIKEVTPAQDFEVEMHLQGRTSRENQTFRIEFYLFDEGMNSLGKMSVLDRSTSLHVREAEGRYGPITDRGNYPINSNNYQHNWEFFFGLVRMRRIGNQFEFYVTRITTGTRHVWKLKKTFNDNDGLYQGRLKYVQIHMGRYGTTAIPNSVKINYIKAFEISQATIDQTPYIAGPGDVIIFDHTTDEILINGEDRTDLKDFGADYFKLAKGYNQLVVHPAASFNTNVRYRNKYR